MKTPSILMLLLFSAIGVLAQNPSKSAAFQSPTPQQYQIFAQIEAPLRIVSAQTKWATPDKRGVEVHIIVENVSQKSILTWATRRGMDSDGAAKSCLGTPHLPARGLLPTEKSGTS